MAYLHDVEFIATRIPEGSTVGDHLKALEQPEKWGLAKEDEGKIRGEGDEQVLEAVRELFKMKNEGKIKAVGITGQFSFSGILDCACSKKTNYPL